VTVDAKAKEKPKQQEKVKDATKEKPTKSLADRLNKLAEKWSDEGDEKGHQLGRSITGSLEESYEAQVQALISESYLLPETLTQDERRKLAFFVRIFIGADGRIMEARIDRSSGNASFDNAVLAGARKVGFVGQPPLNLRRKYAKEGMLLEFCPITCPG
jgi:TonB family protein